MSTPERSDPLWHSLSLEEVVRDRQSSLNGLSSTEAAERLARYGHNTLSEEKRPGTLAMLLGQLANPLIIMLLVAAAISLFAGHAVDAVVILAVVALNSVIGVVQESRAENALEALRQLSAPHARVLRDGVVTEIAAADVVVGDVVVLETGDRVPADLRILESVELALDESALTGESEPVVKHVGEVAGDTPLADMTNMGWTSTAVTAGRGRGVVVETGMHTVIGRIASDVQGTRREDTPLQRRLAKLSVVLGVASVSAAAAIFLFGIIRGFDLVEMLLFSVAAAVSAIPEGLPAVVSVVLAIGVQRMSQRSAIVRRLPAVETLGSTTVVCSDKTGTITLNQMTVREIRTMDRVYTVRGEGFAPQGEIAASDGPVVHSDAPAHASLRALLEVGVLANNSSLLEGSEGWTVQGNPTDGALLAAAGKAGIDPTTMRGTTPRLDEVPFSSSTKYVAALVGAEDAARLLVKGAPERILSFCSHVLTADGVLPLDDAARGLIERANDEMASEALRVVAGAYRDLPAATRTAERDSAESGLVFAGLWGLLDPPREEAIRAIRAAQGAGVRVVMITGDHATTATAIARSVGIVSAGEATLTGQQLDALSDAEFGEVVGRTAVYARVAPEHKSRIVAALKARGEVVAMTGDGVNDAPALKAADIGVAMGVTGTEVAKEAADMVLGDDNFATIVSAIEEGRVIYSNLRRVVAFLLSTTTAEVLTLFTALALGFHLPVTAVMILWINLVTDGITTIPLGLEPKHGDVLRLPPRPTGEGIVTKFTIARLVTLAVLAATATIALFAQASAEADLAYAQTVAFATLAAFEWFKAMTWRTSNQSVFSVGLLSNRWLILALGIGVVLQVLAIQSPFGNLVFGTVPLSGTVWAIVIAAASSVLVVDEIGKQVMKRVRERGRARLASD